MQGAARTRIAEYGAKTQGAARQRAEGYDTSDGEPPLCASARLSVYLRLSRKDPAARCMEVLYAGNDHL